MKLSDFDLNILTFTGLGSRIRVINFMAPKESQGGHVNSAEDIWTYYTENGETTQEIKVTGKLCSKLQKNAHFFI